MIFGNNIYARRKPAQVCKYIDLRMVSTQVFKILYIYIQGLTLWCLAGFGDFREKNTETHVALRKNFSDW